MEYSWNYEGISDLIAGLEYNKLSHFQPRVNRVLKVGRVNNVVREPVMKGRILGCATNKYLKFVADTGSPVAIVPRSVAIRNKLKILPADDDEPSYAGMSGMKLSVVGQCHMLICFKEMKTTKDVRALVLTKRGNYSRIYFSNVLCRLI